MVILLIATHATAFILGCLVYRHNANKFQTDESAEVHAVIADVETAEADLKKEV